MVKCSICKNSGRRIERCSTCKKSFHVICASQNKSTHQCCVNSLKLKKHNICHRCQTNTFDKKVECSNTECNELFCMKCIKYRYKYDMASIPTYWECFVCLKTCSCKSCRKKATEKSKKVADLANTELHNCHQCSKKIQFSKLSYCDKCKNYFCFTCCDQNYKNLDNCPYCLDICTCTKCGDIRFNKDFPEFYKGVDLRRLYPYDLKNIFYVNGFWVRSINL